MEEPEELRPLDGEGSKVIAVLQEDEDNSRYEASRLRRLIPGAFFVLVGLAVLTTLAVTLDSHRRNIFLGGTAAFLGFVFLFGALIVRSYDRDKEKMMKQNPYRDDHIIQ